MLRACKHYALLLKSRWMRRNCNTHVVRERPLATLPQPSEPVHVMMSSFSDDIIAIL